MGQQTQSAKTAIEQLRENQVNDEQAAMLWRELVSMRADTDPAWILLGAVFGKLNKVSEAILELDKRLSMTETDGK